MAVCAVRVDVVVVSVVRGWQIFVVAAWPGLGVWSADRLEKEWVIAVFEGSVVSTGPCCSCWMDPSDDGCLTFLHRVDWD